MSDICEVVGAKRLHIGYLWSEVQTLVLKSRVYLEGSYRQCYTF